MNVSAFRQQALLRGLPLMHWLERLSPRDRQVLAWLAGLTVLVVLWLAVWQPVEAWRQKAMTGYQTVQVDLLWMRSHALQASTPLADKKITSEPLLTSAGNESANFQLNLSHAEPLPDGGLNVTLEDARFSRLLLWLNVMQENYGASVTQLSLEKRNAPGTVGATLTLQP